MHYHDLYPFLMQVHREILFCFLWLNCALLSCLLEWLQATDHLCAKVDTKIISSPSPSLLFVIFLNRFTYLQTVPLFTTWSLYIAFSRFAIFDWVSPLKWRNSITALCLVCDDIYRPFWSDIILLVTKIFWNWKVLRREYNYENVNVHFQIFRMSKKS